MVTLQGSIGDLHVTAHEADPCNVSQIIFNNMLSYESVILAPCLCEFVEYFGLLY